MTNKVLALLLIVIFINCSNKTIDSYSIVGKTNNIKDDTKLILKNLLNKKLLATVLMKNNEFIIEGVLSNAPIQVALQSKSGEYYKVFWLENEELLFFSTKGDFRDAVIIGSKTENYEVELRQRTNKIYIVLDSLYDEFEKEKDSLKQNEIDRVIILKEQEIEKIERKFINDNPNIVNSVAMLDNNKTGWKKDNVSDLFKKLSKNNKESVYGINIKKYLNLNRALNIGDKFVDFKMNNKNDSIVSISQFEGKVILLDFWASWCVPCRKQNPDLVKIYKKYNNQGFEIVSVSLDKNKNNWLKAIEKDGLSWLNLIDVKKGNQNRAALTYGISEIPDNFLIDKNGIIIGRDLLPIDLEIQLKKKLIIK